MTGRAFMQYLAENLRPPATPPAPRLDWDRVWEQTPEEVRVIFDRAASRLELKGE